MSDPRVVVFDINETLSDLSPMATRFADVGLPSYLAATWFASVLRDGFALAATGSEATFAKVADGVLRTLFVSHPPSRDPDAAVQHILEGFSSLKVHPDVPPGVRSLVAEGTRLATLTNGATSIAEELLEKAGIRDAFERLLTVEDAGIWKPAAAAYTYAARMCHVPPEQMMLVAVHPWDIDGAARAGLQTAWIDRAGSPYPPYFTPPGHTVAGVDDLARHLSPAST